VTILAIQSQVVYGHVGNSAAVFALQRLGHEVMAVPTTLLAHHPGHGKPRGRVLPAQEVTDLIEGIEGIGLFRGLLAVTSGYIGDPNSAWAVAGAVATAKGANPLATYLCDPVLGDKHTGLYVPRELIQGFAARLLPAADLATPNQFECERLTGRVISDLASALAAADALRAMGPGVAVITSLQRTDTPEDRVETLAVGPEGAFLVATPLLAEAPHGTGDLFSALFLAHWLKSRDPRFAVARAVSSVYGILLTTADLGMNEMALIAAQDELVAPSRRFEADRVR